MKSQFKTERQKYRQATHFDNPLLKQVYYSDQLWSVNKKIYDFLADRQPNLDINNLKLKQIVLISLLKRIDSHA